MNFHTQKIARLLKLGDLTLRGDRWRFGTKIIGAKVVDRLIDAGIAVREGDRVRLAANAAAGGEQLVEGL